MYNQRSYRNEAPDALRRVIATYPFAILVSLCDGEPLASHLPFMWREGGEHGVLVGHMARANPQWNSWDAETRALVIFLGPHSYISPGWYAEPVAVPTWNYVTVHAYGTPVVTHDPEHLRAMVTRLTNQYEDGSHAGWTVARTEPVMPTELKAIVGFEIPIDRIEGKFKLNQNRSEADQRGVIRALEGSSDRDEREIAELMRRNLDRSEAI